MGCPDSLCGRCPICGEKTYIQTKVFDNCCKSINVGDVVQVSDCYKTMEIRAKECCHKCNFVPIITIVEGYFAGFNKDFAGNNVFRFSELPFGQVMLADDNVTLGTPWVKDLEKLEKEEKKEE